MDVKMNGNMWMIACHGYLPDHINNADTEFVNRFALWLFGSSNKA